MLILPRSAIAVLKEKVEQKVVKKDVEALWTPHPENKPQQQAYYSQIDRLFYGGSVGGGKLGVCYSISWALSNIPCFTVECYDEFKHLIPEQIKRMDTKVLSWDGTWKSFSELKIGDRIMNPDGQHQSILAIYERGFNQVYRVGFEDGTFVDCSADHLWSCWEAQTNSRRKSSAGLKAMLPTDTPIGWNTNYIQRARVVTTDFLCKELAKGRNFIFPVNAPLNFTNLHRGMAERAYLYGALIGDGSLPEKGMIYTLHSADEWIIERCTSILENWKRYDCQDRNMARITIKDRWVDQWARNSGLKGKKSWDKFLPEGYLKESLDFRWALAQGLFDTDGYAATNKNEVSYTSVSKTLADGVASLVRSLGFLAKVFEKQGYCYIDGEKEAKRIAYTVQVQGNQKHKLFSLPRKIKNAQSNESMNWVGKRVEFVKPLLTKEYGRCIKVSNPNSLYITDGYNVTHNSSLVVGLALTQHNASIIFRREYSQLKGVIKESKKFARGHGRYNNTEKTWTELPEGRELSFGAVQYEDDVEKFQGRAHDFMAFDEICHFTRYQFDFLSGWNRPNIPGQRCRIVATGNPPTTPEGQWVREYWGPWLDKTHELYPYPPGEVIWYITVSSKDEIVQVGGDRPAPVERVVKGKTKVFYPHSRSFIPAKLKDNPYLDEAAYLSTLYGLPEALQKALIDGSFDIDWEDAEMQVIPSEWVELAMLRWENSCMLPGTPLSALGVDVARGGKDQTIIVPRRGYWFEELKAYPGASTPDGSYVAGQVAECWEEGCSINIDVVSVGSSPYDILNHTYPNVIPISGGEKSIKSDKSGKLSYYNKRAELYWLFREALDPDSGKNYCLPRSERLKAELCTPKWKLIPPIATEPHKNGRIQITPKEEVKETLGRSPDEADSVVYASHEGITEFEPIQYNLDKRDIAPKMPEIQVQHSFSRPKRSRKGWR
ncbi:MAG: LAGLIDADG family homing endonuclease [Microcoleus sp.]